MSKYKVVLTRQAVKDLELLRRAGLSKRAEALKDILAENPFQNPPPYEKLSGELRGAYSRRINIQHRMVYSVSDDDVVRILRMWTHYE